MTVTLDRDSLMMWNGTVRALPLEQQVLAASLAGCGQLSFTPLDWARAVATGRSSADLLAIAESAGVRLSHLDPLARWSPAWLPSSRDPATDMLPFFSFATDDFLRIAEGMKMSSFTAISIAPADGIDLDRVTEDFAGLCDRAAERGLRCELEFIPLGWGVPDLATAWSIVKSADRANAGIVFDFWHFVRSGSTLDLLRTIPGDRITSVQIADGLLQLPKSRDRFADCLEFRLPAGQGEFPVNDIFTVLRNIGALGRVGPEYFSNELDMRSTSEIATVCRKSTAGLYSVA